MKRVAGATMVLFLTEGIAVGCRITQCDYLVPRIVDVETTVEATVAAKAPAAARRLGIYRTTLRKKLDQFGLGSE